MVLQTGVGLNSYFITYICILIDLFHSILICDVTTITLNQSIKYIDTIYTNGDA